MGLYENALAAGRAAYDQWAQAAKAWDAAKAGINPQMLAEQAGSNFNQYADAISSAFLNSTNALKYLSPQMRDFVEGETRKLYLTQFLDSMSSTGQAPAADALLKALPAMFGGSAGTPGTPAQAAQNYTIKWGDTLWDLSRRFGTTIQNLLAWNPYIKDPDLIYAGKNLVVRPAQAGTPGTPGTSADMTKVGVSRADIDRVYNQFLNAYASDDPKFEALKMMTPQELAGALGLQINSQYSPAGANLINRYLDYVMSGLGAAANTGPQAWLKILQQYR